MRRSVMEEQILNKLCTLTACVRGRSYIVLEIVSKLVQSFCRGGSAKFGLSHWLVRLRCRSQAR